MKDFSLHNLRVHLKIQHKPERSCMRGNVFWMLTKDGPFYDIGAYLFVRSPGDLWEAQEIWDVYQGMYPTCPLSYIELVLETQYSPEIKSFWEKCKNRQNVLNDKVKQAKQISKDVMVGDVVRLPYKNMPQGLIVEKGKKLVAQHPDGTRYIIKYRDIKGFIDRVSRKEPHESGHQTTP